MLFAVCIPIIVLIYLFAVKSDSTSGRILILRTCWEMFKDAPLFGHGFHSFDKNYMLYQASVLKLPEWSMYGIYADNVTHPLSEYMLILVQFGIIGLLLTLCTITVMLVFMMRNKAEYGIYILMTFVSISVLSLFTYPFRYPITTIAVLYCLFENFRIQICRIASKTIIFLIMICSICVGAYGVRWLCYQIKWYNSSNDELFNPVKYAEMCNVLNVSTR